VFRRKFQLIGGRDVPLFGGDQVRRSLNRGHDDGPIFTRKHGHQFEHSVVTPPGPDPAIQQGIAGAAGIVDIESLPDAAADASQLGTRRVERHQRPHLVIVGRCHLGDCADLVEGQAAIREHGPQQRQSLECVAGAHHLATCPDVNADVDRQPVRARPNAGIGP